MDSLKVLSVNISEKKGTVKLPVPEIRIGMQGIEGDAHAGDWNRQVSLLGTESIAKFSKEAGRIVNPGEFAENLTTEGMELWNCHPLDRFASGEVELEISQIGKECHGTSCAIFRETGNCVMPKEGIFCRVIKPGIVKPGNLFSFIPRCFKVLVITLSDRASKGEYEDRSGPRVVELLTEFFSEMDFKFEILTNIIPDESFALKDLIISNTKIYDLIITTGGTGIGPRDITPDTIKPLLHKEIPGIMEHIRLKYGSNKPQALLSRGIAGTIGHCLVFTLPGSVKAVNEYMNEILKSFIHMVYMIHGLDLH
ncbi:MAG: molybdopterin-binding protein [Bacteroidia bacterium]|nr:molybdopterin-binding protein [Bacteroidia bacterium]